MTLWEFLLTVLSWGFTAWPCRWFFSSPLSFITKFFLTQSENQWAQWATRSLLGQTGPQSRAWNHSWEQIKNSFSFFSSLLGHFSESVIRVTHMYTLCSGVPLNLPSLGSPTPQHHSLDQDPAEDFIGTRLASEHGCRCRYFRARVGCGICLLGWEKVSWHKEVR